MKKNIHEKLACFFLLTHLFFISALFVHADSLSMIGKLGVMSFIPGRLDPKFTESWGTTGILYGGEVVWEIPQVESTLSFGVPQAERLNEISLELTYVKASRTSTKYIGSFWGTTTTSTDTNLLAVMLSAHLRCFADSYVLCGLGRVLMRGRVGVALFSQEFAENDFAFQFGAGENLMRTLRAEIKYLYGGRNGNSGIIIWLGPRIRF